MPVALHRKISVHTNILFLYIAIINVNNIYWPYRYINILNDFLFTNIGDIRIYINSGKFIYKN